MLLHRNDVRASAFPSTGQTLVSRTDLPASAFPSRGGGSGRGDVPYSYLTSSTAWAIRTEWLGRLAGLIAVVLMVLVFQAIHKGLVVQKSARGIVTDFHTANGYFDTRANLNDPAKVRQQLVELQGVLTSLNQSTATDVTALSAVLPVVDRLLKAGKGDVQIAADLRDIANTLSGSAGALRSIATDANGTVSQVDAQLSEALHQIDLLNAQLTRTTNKLAILPATGGNK